MHGLNQYDIEARYYDPPTGRFTTVDPRAEKYYSTSPYVYCLNNPLKYIDPNGDTVRVYTETVDKGHSWISTGEGDDLTIYSFEPDSQGKRTPTNAIYYGKGKLIIKKGEKAQDYINNKKNKTDMEVFTISDLSDKDIVEVVNTYIANGEVIETFSYKNGESQYIKTEKNYFAPLNNCTTFVSDVLNEAGSKIFETTRTVTDRKHGEVYDVTTKRSFTYPSNMRDFLRLKTK